MRVGKKTYSRKSGKGSISLDNGRTTIPWSPQAESLFMPWAM
jgi:hypothetical protein